MGGRVAEHPVTTAAAAGGIAIGVGLGAGFVGAQVNAFVVGCRIAVGLAQATVTAGVRVAGLLADAANTALVGGAVFATATASASGRVAGFGKLAADPLTQIEAGVAQLLAAVDAAALGVPLVLARIASTWVAALLAQATRVFATLL